MRRPLAIVSTADAPNVARPDQALVAKFLRKGAHYHAGGGKVEMSVSTAPKIADWLDPQREGQD